MPTLTEARFETEKAANHACLPSAFFAGCAWGLPVSLGLWGVVALAWWLG